MRRYITDISNKVYLKESDIKEKKAIENINTVIRIDTNKIVGSFLGFGSAITESSGFNYYQLSQEKKKKFISDYFSKSGLNLTYGRISIGSNDFSLSAYSYAKKKNLSDFNIKRDLEYVVPFLKDILNTKQISLIASPWSPPRIYKKLPLLYYGISLAKRHYENYSMYLIKYLNEYQKLGINISYITIQNEPMARQRWESCKFSLASQKDFIYNYLLPKLNNTKILLWDHNKDNLFNIVNELYLKNSKIAGTCFHYYTGHCFEELKKIREKYPDMLLINSEMCTGYSPFNEINWIRDAEYYLNDIIGDMNSGVNAYLDWNILLDNNGGPTYKKNYVKSASIRISNNYIKSPIYYYLYHISHFLGKNNQVVESYSSFSELKVVSIKQENKIVIVIMNNSNKRIDYNMICDNKLISDSINKHSIITYIS